MMFLIVDYNLIEKGQLVFINRWLDCLRLENGDSAFGFKELGKSGKTLLVQTENGEFFYWLIDELKTLGKSVDFNIENIVNLRRSIDFPTKQLVAATMITKSIENYHLFLKDLTYTTGQLLSTRPHFIQLKQEIEQMFCKKTLDFSELLHSLDNSFSKQREVRKNEQLKTRKKLDLLSQEIRKFNEKTCIKRRECSPKVREHHNNLRLNQDNFSFAKEKSEKPLDFFLNLINSKEQRHNENDFRSLKMQITSWEDQSTKHQQKENPIAITLERDSLSSLMNGTCEKPENDDQFEDKRGYEETGGQLENNWHCKPKGFKNTLDNVELSYLGPKRPLTSKEKVSNFFKDAFSNEISSREMTKDARRASSSKANVSNFFNRALNYENDNLFKESRRASSSKANGLNFYKDGLNVETSNFVSSNNLKRPSISHNEAISPNRLLKNSNSHASNFFQNANKPPIYVSSTTNLLRDVITPPISVTRTSNRFKEQMEPSSLLNSLQNPLKDTLNASISCCNVANVVKDSSNHSFLCMNNLDGERDAPRSSIYRCKTPENVVKSSFISRNFGFSETKSKRLDKRMDTFGLEYVENLYEQGQKHKGSAILENRASELNVSSQRSNTKKGAILEIAKKISGNLEELVGRLAHNSASDSERNEENNINDGKMRCLIGLFRSIVQRRKADTLFALKEYCFLIGTQRNNKRKNLGVARFLAGKLKSTRKRVMQESWNLLKEVSTAFEKRQRILADREASSCIFKVVERGRRRNLSFSFKTIKEIVFNHKRIHNLMSKINKKSLLRRFLNKWKSCVEKTNKICELFDFLSIKIARKKKDLMRKTFECLEQMCSFEIKREKLATLKTLGFNKLLFILFEIFSRKLKSGFQCIRNNQVYMAKSHQKKISLRNIMETMETLVEHQRSLGLNKSKNKCKFSKIQFECLFHVFHKLASKRIEPIFNGIKTLRSRTMTAKRASKKENLPRKATNGEIETLMQNNINGNLTYFEMFQRKNRQKSNEKTTIMNNSGQQEQILNQSFGNISKIMLNNSNDSDLSLFNLKKSSQFPNKHKEKEQQTNTKKVLQNQLKLLSSDFHDPKDPNLLFSENVKEDMKTFGLAEPHELQETSVKPQPALILQDLNCDLISPKISEKQRKNLEKNYCSLVQYRSVSPKKPESNRDFESYLKDFKEDVRAVSHFKEEENNNNKENINEKASESLSMFSMGNNDKRVINNNNKENRSDKPSESLSIYSVGSASGNNYKRVIENQKRFIGNFHKQVYNTISGRISSPSYQDYVNERKKK